MNLFCANMEGVRKTQVFTMAIADVLSCSVVGEYELAEKLVAYVFRKEMCSTLEMEASSSSETLMPTCQTARFHRP
jgi:hypothetical protein